MEHPDGCLIKCAHEVIYRKTPKQRNTYWIDLQDPQLASQACKTSEPDDNNVFSFVSRKFGTYFAKVLQLPW